MYSIEAIRRRRRRPVLPALKLGKSLRFREDQLAEWIRQLSEQRVI